LREKEAVYTNDILRKKSVPFVYCPNYRLLRQQMFLKTEVEKIANYFHVTMHRFMEGGMTVKVILADLLLFNNCTKGF